MKHALPRTALLRVSVTPILTAILATSASGQTQPVCLISHGLSLFRVSGGTVEEFPNQPAQITAMTTVPPGITVYLCNQGDVLGFERDNAGRVYRIDNARSGTPSLVRIGDLPGGISFNDMAFAHERLFGIANSATADFYELNPLTFAPLGSGTRLRPTGGLNNIGGLTFDGVGAWYLCYAGNVVRLADPPTAASWTPLGPSGVSFDTNDLETYQGQIWGAVAIGSVRVLVGTFNLQSGAFNQVYNIPTGQGGSTGLAMFTPGCIGIDRQPAAVSACSGGAQFSVVAAGLGPFQYQWQIQTGAATWVTLGNDAFPLPCGGFAYASPANAWSTHIGITPCPGTATYQVRCVIMNSCGSVTSDPVAYTVCYANCDCSTGTPSLNVNDFVCFQTQFAAANPSADCDRNGTLNVGDFVCFQGQFAAGCP